MPHTRILSLCEIASWLRLTQRMRIANDGEVSPLRAVYPATFQDPLVQRQYTWRRTALQDVGNHMRRFRRWTCLWWHGSAQIPQAPWHRLWQPAPAGPVGPKWAREAVAEAVIALTEQLKVNIAELGYADDYTDDLDDRYTTEGTQLSMEGRWMP